MFEPFVIVVLESLNCPQCEKMDVKIEQSLLKRVHICSCGSVVEHCVSSARVVGSIPREYTY